MGNDHPANPTRLGRDAFAQIVDRHQHALHTFLRGFIGHDEQARDLVQDTFHDAWRLTQKGSAPFVSPLDDDGVRRWLFHTAYCHAVSLLRRRHHVRWESLDAVTELLPAEVDFSFEDRIAETESLRAAMGQLSTDDVACLLLRVVQGFSAAEVGSIIGATTDVVHKRLSRAKQRLRAAYLAQTTPSKEQPAHG